jgi:pimeloyl-ACP methyl ester carboxylesterase
MKPTSLLPDAAPPVPITLDDVMQDLEAGRSLPLPPTEHPLRLRTPPRPTLPGRTFLRTSLAARALGRIHPRLARRWLLRLWFTPWVHPKALQVIDAVPSQLATWSLPVGGRTLHGYTGGTGRTVVLVHGWAGRAADWRHLAADLIADGWRVVVPDLPAHGRTAGERTDLFELGRALAVVLDHERPAAIVAHSLGFPTTLRALEEGAPVPTAIVALAPGRKLGHAVDGFTARAGLRPALAGELRRAIEHRFGRDIWTVLDVDPVLADLDVAGLVIHDADDQDVPITDGRAIAERWPRAAFRMTSGLGHRRILRDETVRRVVVDAVRPVQVSGPGRAA